MTARREPIANPTVEFRVPVSPSPEFALMLSVLAASLRRFGGIDSPRVSVFIGAPASRMAACEALAKWMPPELSPVIVDPAEFEAQSFHATAAARLYRPAEADVVVLIDADVVFCGDVAALCSQIAASPAVAGVVAHIAPLSRADWQRAFHELGLAPEFPYRYTGWPYLKPPITESESLIQAPAYFNFGFVATSAELLESLGVHFERCLQRVDHLFPDLMFRSQVALTLALAAAGAPARELPMRYNFANDYCLEALHPDELRDARMIHLLRRNQGLDKQELYRSLDTLEAFVAESWRWAGAAARAREAVAAVLHEVERMEPPEGLAPAPWAW